MSEDVRFWRPKTVTAPKELKYLQCLHKYLKKTLVIIQNYLDLWNLGHNISMAHSLDIFHWKQYWSENYTSFIQPSPTVVFRDTQIQVVLLYLCLWHLNQNIMIYRHKIQYRAGILVQVTMAISTNQKPTIYRNLYENTGPDIRHCSLKIMLEFKFLPAWSCVSLPRSTIWGDH